MLVAKVKLPLASVLNTKGEFNYSDSYSGFFLSRQKNITIESIAEIFFTSSPSWINILFAIRNWIVSFFGLKTGNEKYLNHNSLSKIKWKEGEVVGLFRVYSKTENEIVLGEDDSHLDFRVSLILENRNDSEKEIIISTIVKFHSLSGRAYFLFIKPFHRLIVKAMLKKILTTLENVND